MKIKIKEKGKCWNNSPLSQMSCMVCHSKSLSFETTIDDTTGQMITNMTCSCGAAFEIIYDNLESKT